jgi:uncharacterized delta-60 repeat protein
MKLPITQKINAMKKITFIFATYFSVLTSVFAQQPGTIDPTFNPSDHGFNFGNGPNNTVRSCAVQSDGKIIIGGEFTSYNGTAVNHIARLNIDGSLDNTFNSGSGTDQRILSIFMQNDGKIIIGGDFNTYNGTVTNSLARLNINGTIDNSFTSGLDSNSYIQTIVSQSDGKIIIGGSFIKYNGVVSNNVARLNTNGTRDNSFTSALNSTGEIYAIALQSDGKLIIGGTSTQSGGWAILIARLNHDGTRDTSFISGFNLTTNYINVETLAIQSDGKVLIGGAFNNYDGTSVNSIVRVNTDGSIDNSFTSGLGLYTNVITSVIQSDGKIIIGGCFNNYDGITISGIARLNTSGSLDTTFNTNGIGTYNNGYVLTIAKQDTGKIIIGGGFNTYNGIASNYIARLNADGSLDNILKTIGTGANGRVGTMAIQSDGKIIIGGDFDGYNGTPAIYIARLNADGSLDTTFVTGTGFKDEIITYPFISTISLQSDGKIIIGGGFTSYNGVATNNIVRLNTNGTIDNTFITGTGIDSWVYSTIIQNDGKIIIGGDFYHYNGTYVNSFIRLNPNGTLDTTFSTGSLVVRAMALQNDGKIIIGGWVYSSSGVPADNYLIRYNTNGSIDNTFSDGTIGSDAITNIKIQSDGKIIICGILTKYGGNTINNIARINTNGTLDNTFISGIGVTYDNATIALQNDGKIIIGGTEILNGLGISFAKRLNTNGTNDNTFTTGTGPNDPIQSIAIQSDGKIIIGGDFTAYNGTGRNRIARIFGGTACQTPTSPTSIIGNSSICFGSTTTYSVAAVSGATSYIWTLPGAWSGASTTNSISAIASANSGSITVKAQNSCGSSSVQSLAVIVKTIPITPATISGNSTICSSSSNTYSVSAVSGATSYIWTLPSGWSGASTTNSISVIASAINGNITVKATNSCGSSSVQSLAVIVKTIPVTPATISGNSTICLSSSNTYSVSAVSGATSYIWTLPSGWSGASTTNSISVIASAINGNITVKATNSCGSSSVQSLAVIVKTIPATPTISQAGLILTSSGSTGNQWYKNGTLISGATAQTYTVTTNGTYHVLVTIAGCTSIPSASVAIINVGIEEIDNAYLFTIYPNPNEGTFDITFKVSETSTYKLELYNAIGQLIFKDELVDFTGLYTKKINVAEYGKGIYSFSLSNSKNETVKKIVVY